MSLTDGTWSRRRMLAGLGTGAAIGLAGCSGSSDGGGDSTADQTTTKTSYGNVPPVIEDRPDEPYYPTHVEGMKMVGRQDQGDYACALTYSFPHRFWLVTGTRTRKVVITKDDSVHLMPVVWNTDAKLVPPDISPQITLERDGETVADFAPWPMLSQPMGFHFGDNVALPGDGTYTVTVDVGSPSGRRTSGLTPNDSMTFQFEWDFREAEVQSISYRDISGQREGLPGAVPPMDMMTVGMSQAPKSADIPGTSTNLGLTAGAEFHATILDDATPYGGSSDQSYLAILPRTKYNRYILPMMSLSATLSHNGETVHDGPLSNALEPELGYHYGTTVSHAGTGAELDLQIDAPPQTARHEGYETAFVEMEGLSGSF